MLRTLLVVEDTDHVMPLAIALSALQGFAVRVLTNGREALELIRSDSFDLAALVTDLHLPYVDGFELIEAVRRDGRYAELPIVVISGDAHPDTPARVEALGADAFFPKPYSPLAIRHSLEVLLHAD